MLGKNYCSVQSKYCLMSSLELFCLALLGLVFYFLCESKSKEKQLVLCMKCEVSLGPIQINERQFDVLRDHSAQLKVVSNENAM